MTIDDFAAFDEFPVGGRQATGHLVAQLALAAGDQVLDIGCELGGAARFVEDHIGYSVAGIDLSEETVQTGTAINRWVGLDNRIDLRRGSALALTFGTEDRFDLNDLEAMPQIVQDEADFAAEAYTVEGALHAFLNDERADAYCPEATEESWQRTVA